MKCSSGDIQVVRGLQVALVEIFNLQWCGVSTVAVNGLWQQSSVLTDLTRYLLSVESEAVTYGMIDVRNEVCCAVSVDCLPCAVDRVIFNYLANYVVSSKVHFILFSCDCYYFICSVLQI